MGLGYYEYFLLCEDLGAKPVPVLPGGYNPHTHEAAVGDELKEYIQDALDLIEFANGDAESYWGSRRAAMGHPEPFHIEYIGIGNEEWENRFLSGTLFFTGHSGRNILR